MCRSSRLAGWAIALVALSPGVGSGADAPLVQAGTQDKKEVAPTARRADVDARDRDGMTALHRAARAGDSAMARTLLAAGANVNVANRFGITPLWLAATNGDAAMVATLLKAGADADVALPSGETPLVVAAHSGSAEAVRLLIAHGANANAREGVFGQTALMLAAAENHVEVCKVLLEAGANLHARTIPPPIGRPRGLSDFPIGSFTALLYAARQGSIEAARVLIAAGAPLDHQGDPVQRVHLGDEEVITRFQEVQSDPDSIRPLRLSIFNGHFDFAAMLIEAGADVNAVDNVGRTPLYDAVAMHRLELMAGRPAPPLLGTRDSLDIVKLLLARGADPNIGLTTPEPLRKGGTYPDSLLGPGTTPFLKAAKNNDIPVMRVLLEYGADPYVQSPTVKASALALAAGVGWRDLSSNAPEKDGLEAVKMLWELGGFDINAKVAGGFAPGQTALHGAASRDAASIIQYLVDHGANLDAKDNIGRTPLVAAGPIEEGATNGTHAARPRAQAILRKLMDINQVATRR